MIQKWYVVSTQSGQENKIKVNLERQLEQQGFKDKISRVLVPCREATVVKGGKKKTITKIFFPGYVFIEMDLTNELWAIVKSTPGVKSFIGSSSKPIPITDIEMTKVLEQIEQQKKKVFSKTTFSKGDSVKIIEGPFAGFSGMIDEINEEKAKLKVLVTIFGRSTPVEINVIGVELI